MKPKPKKQITKINNNNEINTQCEQIIYEIIYHYAENQLETLNKILIIKTDTSYENFKNMLNNYLRKYFAEEIEKYYQSEEFKKLGFFKKKSKKKQILNILNEIGKYKFNQTKINEVLK